MRGAGGAFCINAVATAFALMSQIILARTLGAPEFGVFACAIAWLNVAVLPVMLGADVSLVRFVPHYVTREEWSRLRGVLIWSRRLTIALSLGLSMATIAAALALHERLDSDTLQAVCLAAASLPLLAAVALNQAALQGLKQVFHSQAPRLIVRPVLLTAGLLAVGLLSGRRPNAATALTLNAAALGAALVLGRVWLRRAVPAAAAAAAPHSERRRWLRVSVPLLLVSGTVILMQESGVLLLGLLEGATQAGVFSVAVRIVRLMAFGMAAGSVVAGPLFSELHTQSDLRCLQATCRLTGLIAFGAALVCGAILFALRWLALGAFGPAFAAGADVIGILAVGQLINAAMGPTGELLNMTGHQDVNARILVSLTIVSLAAGYFAIRGWGLLGAAAVQSATLALQNVWAWYEVRRRLGIDSTPFGLVVTIARRRAFAAG